VESPNLAPPLALATPPAILVAGALLACIVWRARSTTAFTVKAVASMTILLALVTTYYTTHGSIPLISTLVGASFVPSVYLELGATALAWTRLLLLAGLAIVTVVPTRSISIALLLLAAASSSFLAPSFAAICFTWVATEACFYLFEHYLSDRPVVVTQYLLPAATMTAAFYATALSSIATPTNAAIGRVSTVLIIVAVYFRLRLWPLRWPLARKSQTALWILAAGLTSFHTLMRVLPAGQSQQPPGWIASAMLISAIVTALYAWLQHSDGRSILRWAWTSLACLLFLLAVTTPRAANLAAIAAAYLVMGGVLYALTPSLPLSAHTPEWSHRAVSLVAASTLLPWPFTPFGKAMAQLVNMYLQLSPSLAILVILVLATTEGSLLSSAFDKAPVRTTEAPDNWRRVALPLALSAMLAFSRAPSLAMSTTRLPAASAQTNVLILGSILLAMIIMVAQYRAIGEQVLLPPTQARTSSSARLSATFGSIALALDSLFRFIEGETALTWGVLVGVAIIVIASGA